ncbi:hypothetical protein N9567_04815 [Planktomarina temperata]|nr:hypothetical protein [Planktomarina temperata]
MTTKMIKRFMVLITFLMGFFSHVAAASNEETLKYIIADYQDQCEKAQQDFRDVDYEESDPVVAELKLSEDNIYEITIDKDGKTATVLHAQFGCTNVGYSWCGSGGCDSYVIVEGVSYSSWGGKPVSVQNGDRYVVLIPRGGLACHNSADIGLSNAAPCYTAAVWDSLRKTFNSASGSQYVLMISEFEP